MRGSGRRASEWPKSRCETRPTSRVLVSDRYLCLGGKRTLPIFQETALKGRNQRQCKKRGVHPGYH